MALFKNAQARPFGKQTWNRAAVNQSRDECSDLKMSECQLAADNAQLRGESHGRIQAVVATWPVSVDRRNPSSASAGVFQPRVLRGLLLRAIATAARSSALCTLRSVPFGKYWRSSPLVFSFVPRCQGL